MLHVRVEARSARHLQTYENMVSVDDSQMIFFYCTDRELTKELSIQRTWVEDEAYNFGGIYPGADDF
jgi:hypothetical protein